MKIKAVEIKLQVTPDVYYEIARLATEENLSTLSMAEKILTEYVIAEQRKGGLDLPKPSRSAGDS